MSNQFYKYLTDKLITYFEENSVSTGERYYVQLDEQNQVKEFYEVLRKEEKASPFIYCNAQGGSYETFAIVLNGVKLVVAATIGVTPGYLVHIRNASKEQVGEWKGSALLILCAETLDSINGGCCDLKKEGMPLSVKSIARNLEEEIAQSDLTKVNKEILRFYKEEKLADSYNTSIWDYEEILSIIQQKDIYPNDYNNIGIFQDKALDTFTSKGIQNRLRDNRELYQKVEACQEYEDREQQLEKIFDKKGVNLLKGNSWREVDFSEVKTSYDTNKNQKPLKYLDNSCSVDNSDITIWDKGQSDTVAGQRKRNIIVFNNGKKSEITISLKFDQNLYSEFIQAKSRKYMSVSKSIMKLKLSAEEIESTFYHLVYEHNNQTKSKYEFNVAILNIEECFLKNIQTKYEIKTGSSAKNRIQIASDGTPIIFGNEGSKKEILIENNDDIVNISEENQLVISDSSSAWDDDCLRFQLQSAKGIVPIEIKELNLRKRPINSFTLHKMKREMSDDFIWEDNRIKLGTQEFYLEEKLRNFLEKEKMLIEKEMIFGEEILGEIEPIELELNSQLKDSYMKILHYYKAKKTIPSLSYLSEELAALYFDFLSNYNKEVKEIVETESLCNNKKKLNLIKIGAIKSSDRFMLSPLSPINIAYQLELNKQLGKDIVENHILDRLRQENLVPYIYDERNSLLRSIYQNENVEWIIYEYKEKVSVGTVNEYVARVIKEKMVQFKTHFFYMFSLSNKAPMYVNIINIKNDYEVVRGVFSFIKEQIDKNAEDIIPVEVRIYNNGQESAFDFFFKNQEMYILEEAFDISFESKNDSLDAIDVLRLIQENIRYFNCLGKEYKYAHISFCKPEGKEKEVQDNMSDMESGISLGGLMSTVVSNNKGNDYRIGFGKKHAISLDELIRTAYSMNELALNCSNGGSNPYRKDTSIGIKLMMLESKMKETLYDCSHWVTFIEPNFGLEYFSEDQEHNLVVIHYSDQYSTSENYDTITVTNKSNQYQYIIKEYLSHKNISASDSQISEIIKSFNSINGEWLLNLIAQKNEYDREKLSIIAALKYCLSILDHPDILWIPISMEEVLRISGAVKLNRSEGIFTIKNLKQKGVHSDDLLFIGLHANETNDIKVYFYPVEVKIGYNFSTTIDKAKNQIDKTFNLLKEQLDHYGDENEKAFKNKFFRNFFIKLACSNAGKLLINGIWPSKQFEKINDMKHKLLNDEYNISFKLEPYIGKGSIISFKKDNYYRSISLDENIMFIELTEEDAYSGIVKSMQELDRDVLENQIDIPKSRLLRFLDIDDIKEDEKLIIEQDKEIYTQNLNQYILDEEEYNMDEEDFLMVAEEVAVTEQYKVDDKYDIHFDNGIKMLQDSDLKENKYLKDEISDINVLLGKAENSNKDIYWEYGNPGLANRHMLITGKSGNGKTYFIQCALQELIRQGVPAIIIDYTDGFKMGQLESEFKEFLGDNIQQFIVARDKFPLNVFKVGQKEIDEGFYMDEDYVDVAERFRSVIAAVYKNLGIQQLNAIYKACLNGLNNNQGKFNLNILRQELEEEKSSNAQTALSQLNLLFDKAPFIENEEFDWSVLEKKEAKVYIIQLTTYSRDIQRIITEMILWDLWNYKTQHGSKDKPFAVVLDEAQNLNFGTNSPITKVLKEGRKFGWSAWLATQYLYGELDKSAISSLQNSAQKIYFAQTEQEAAVVANTFAQSADDKKVWNKTLINLEKGQCITYGPIKDGSGRLLPAKPIKIRITPLVDRELEITKQECKSDKEDSEDVGVKKKIVSFVNNKETATVMDNKQCDGMPIDESYESIIDRYITKINLFRGKTDYEICNEYGREYNANKSQWIELAYRILGIKSNQTEELKKQNIIIKTIRVNAKGKIKENMSLPQFKFKELASEVWEQSTLRQYFLKNKFLFVVFKENEEETYTLMGAKFWSMNSEDLNDVMIGWRDIQDTINNGVELVPVSTNNGVVITNNLPKKSNNRIIHVRPHASKSYNIIDGVVYGNGNKSNANELLNGDWMTNQSFWLNSEYIQSIIEDLI